MKQILHQLLPLARELQKSAEEAMHDISMQSMGEIGSRIQIEDCRIEFGNFLLKRDVPGYAAHHLKVQRRGNYIYITGENPDRGTFDDKFELSGDLLHSDITTNLRLGVLTVIITPKATKEDVVEIPVK